MVRALVGDEVCVSGGSASRSVHQRRRQTDSGDAVQHLAVVGVVVQF